MLDSEAYKIYSGIVQSDNMLGGQELILFEIMSLLYNHRRVYIPFMSSQTLYNYLSLNGFDVWNAGRPFDIPKNCGAVYFGTPTILNDRPLFPQSVQDPIYWNKKTEREWVRQSVMQFKTSGYKRIISGLGSGDISTDERLQDMGGGKIVCYKNFGDFEDWVLVRDL